MNPQSMFGAKIRKNIFFFYLKIIIFTAVKNHCILHRRVIVMISICVSVASSSRSDMVGLFSFKPICDEWTSHHYNLDEPTFIRCIFQFYFIFR